MIKNCSTCKPNKFQDETYGKNMRVMNKTNKGSKDSGEKYRCTVCGNDKG